METVVNQTCLGCNADSSRSYWRYELSDGTALYYERKTIYRHDGTPIESQRCLGDKQPDFLLKISDGPNP
jgi:hypothetical protein